MATVADWIDACRRQGIALRRRGQEHCGPCPICQTGDDRFWIKPGRVQPVLAHCRHGHTYRELHRALLGDSFETPVRPRRRRPAAAPAELADSTLSDQAHRARRLFAAAHRGQPTYFRRKFPESDRLVWTHRDMWLVPLKPFADGHLLPGIADAQFILPDGTKRFQRHLRLSGLATSPRWRAAGPLLLTEGVTSALAVALSITDPPLGILACLSPKRPPRDGQTAGPAPRRRHRGPRPSGRERRPSRHRRRREDRPPLVGAGDRGIRRLERLERRRDRAPRRVGAEPEQPVHDDDGRPSMTIRWRVLATDEAGVVRVDVDTGNGFRAATAAEVDQALRQLPLFGAADVGAHEAAPKRRLPAERVESRGLATGRA